MDDLRFIIVMDDLRFRKASDLLLGWITMLDNAISQVFFEGEECKALRGFFEEFRGTTLPKHLQQFVASIYLFIIIFLFS